MKIHILQYAGSILLLVCMVFALAKLGTADRWVAMWLPFVIAGVGLVFFGTVAAHRKNASQNDHR
jgi:cell division protein FtsW (lipid II flippase)